ncbi:MAG: glycogen debranching enzyme family protein [Prolixibacteraceae bacterium]|nr:glycogen debranching enzyme family protein [Prolixibacteraceae bacterium]MBN2648740.1 glycogen debranching enzyme family protein [Prolixibacteraceae bacterium]
MSYLKFDKKELVNLEYSLKREVLHSNRAGSYSCTSLSGCNTRKYHGLLVCPNYTLDGGKHVLLSTLDATIIQHGSEFNLGIHKFKGENYEPKGHKYIRDFECKLIPVITYRIGGVILTMETLLVEQTEQVLIRYTLVEAHSPTRLRLKPFLAFRNMHMLSKSNMNVNTHYTPVENGIKVKMYEGYPELHLQLTKKNEYIANPDWYYDIEYYKEKMRGYDYLEDLYVPGYFETDIKKGESIIFSGATFEAFPKQLQRKFNAELKKKTPRTSFFGCLHNSAEQFFVKTNEFTDILAGFPWYNGRINQTFVALPGLSYAMEDPTLIKRILRTNIKRLKNGLFPAKWGRIDSNYASADAPLWFFWTIQKLTGDLGGPAEVWKSYKKIFTSILNAYKNGTDFNIKMLDNGLINAHTDGVALTWMNAYANGVPVTPRYGMAVEINALWYNALKYSIELAENANEKKFVNEWTPIAQQAETSFIETFWDEKRQYLADYCQNGQCNYDVRPNQVIAAAMDYSPLSKEMKKSIISLANKDLLTARGLRTLSPKNPLYEGKYDGDETTREKATHQGTAHPWLIGFFIEAYLKVHKHSGISFAKSIMDGFEEEMSRGCIGSISELYSGNPPHECRGAISQAWNIGEIIRAHFMVENHQAL